VKQRIHQLGNEMPAGRISNPFDALVGEGSEGGWFM
jgi:hypothetical protein